MTGIASFALRIALALTAVWAPAALASPFFSIAPVPGTSFPATSNSAVLAPGPIGGPPVVVIPPPVLGVAGAPVDDVNAMTVPGPLNAFFFSVDAASTGTAGAVVTEAAAGQAAGDVFSSTFTGSNTLAINQSLLGLLPPIAPGLPSSPPIDNVDGLDFVGGPPLFAMITGHPYSGTFTGCGADVFGPGPSLVISYITLGLASCSDDIDALHIDSATGDVYFSLAPGSPSFSILGLPGPAAIYVSPGGSGPVGTVYTAATLGLKTTDNVDAIAWDAPASVPVPALAAYTVVLLWLLMLGGAWTLREARGATAA
jgi:hypothetical protein